jgi:hypothetical protein
MTVWLIRFDRLSISILLDRDNLDRSRLINRSILTIKTYANHCSKLAIDLYLLDRQFQFIPKIDVWTRIDRIYFATIDLYPTKPLNHSSD